MTAHTLRTGVIAGLIAGVLMGAFSILASTLATHQPLDTSAVAFLQYVAAGAIGKATAYSSTSYVWLGAVVHLLISIAWATGFVYLAQTRRQLLARPFVSGIAFGFVVWILMQVVLIGAGLFANPTPKELANALIAHCIFFGLPVAYVTARATR